MKNRILFGAVAALLCFSSAASATDVFVRNRPFKQVVVSGSEAFVPADAFLRSLGYNWNVKGQTVTLTSDPSANQDFPTGSLTFVYGDKTLSLDSSLRGTTAYVSMIPLARLLDYNVNRSAGIIDVTKGRAVTDKDRKIAADISKEKADEEKAIDAAWAKKAADIKEKRDAAADKDKKDDDKDDKDKDKDKSDKSKKPSKADTKAADQVAMDKAAADKAAADKAAADKKAEPKPTPRLEIFRSDARPDYSTGIIQIESEIRNQGNGASGAVTGVLVLYGPNTDGTSEIEYYRTNVRGPVLKPDASWTYHTEFRHREGASMPHGTLRVDLKLN